MSALLCSLLMIVQSADVIMPIAVCWLLFRVSVCKVIDDAPCLNLVIWVRCL